MATRAQKRAAERRAQRQNERRAEAQRKANQQKAENKGGGKGKGKGKAGRFRPPPAYYDPALDANLREAKKGYNRLNLVDTPEAKEQLETDWILGNVDLARQKTELGQDYTRGVDDTNRSFGRSLDDLLKQRTEGQQDYTTNLATLQRNYDRLGSAQAQTARAAGVAGGGAMAQAAQKRAANQAIEKAPVDTNFNRFMGASQIAQTRLGQDKQSALDSLLLGKTRGEQAIGRAGGAAALAKQRSGSALDLALARAGTDLGDFKLDTNTARIRQAIANNWVPPGKNAKKPKNNKPKNNKPGGKKVGKVLRHPKIGLPKAVKF